MDATRAAVERGVEVCVAKDSLWVELPSQRMARVVFESGIHKILRRPDGDTEAVQRSFLAHRIDVEHPCVVARGTPGSDEEAGVLVSILRDYYGREPTLVFSETRRRPGCASGAVAHRGTRFGLTSVVCALAGERVICGWDNSERIAVDLDGQLFSVQMMLDPAGSQWRARLVESTAASR
jgi:hypothetical protein